MYLLYSFYNSSSESFVVPSVVGCIVQLQAFHNCSEKAVSVGIRIGVNSQVFALQIAPKYRMNIEKVVGVSASGKTKSLRF